MKIDLSEVERRDGSRVTEMMAMYGSTVLDVQHVGQVESRHDSAQRSMATGVLMILLGGGAFALDVAHDWDGHRKQVEAALESGRPVPAEPGTGLGTLGLALAFLGLVPLVTGAMRQQDVGLDSYTIGEGHEVALHVPTDGLPDPESFSLVSGDDHEATLGFTPEMTGFVTLGGQQRTLVELVASGEAHWMGSSYAFALPPDAVCVVDHGCVTFRVRSVAPGRLLGQELQVDKPFWLHNVASLVVLGSLLVLTHFVPGTAFDMGLDDLTAERRFVGTMNRLDVAHEGASSSQEDASGDEAARSTTQRRASEARTLAKAASTHDGGLVSMRGPRDAAPVMARNLTPDMVARNAGILAMLDEHSGTFLASPNGGAFSTGGADEDVWGGSIAEIGQTPGLGGLGLVGTGRGGGGTGEGTVGFDDVGLGGGGGCRRGRACGYGRGSGAGFGGRGKRVPQVRMAQAKVCGIEVGRCGLPPEVIRRVVRAHINEVRYCYNQGLARDPTMSGRVTIRFTIDRTGRVPAAAVQDSTIGDHNVANCVTKAVRRWSFPTPDGSSHVMVTYPFVFAPG
jgi:TonB family protein